MSILGALRRSANVVLRAVRLCLVRSDTGKTMEEALAHWASRFPIATIIDVGASDGRWCERARSLWPSAECLLIEAQTVHEPALRRSGIRYVIAAAGEREGELHFDAAEPFGGVASEAPTSDHDIVVRSVTLDEEARRHNLAGPFLVKLDTHGYELPILRGASRVLGEASLVLVEAYNFTLRDGAPRFHELCDCMEQRGFRCLDMVDPLRRPDGALWQMDLIFARHDRPEFRDNRFGIAR
jgi:FkbM family methyltransferase